MWYWSKNLGVLIRLLIIRWILFSNKTLDIMCHFVVMKMDQLSVLFSLPSLILVFNGLLLLITFSYFLQQSIV